MKRSYRLLSIVLTIALLIGVAPAIPIMTAKAADSVLPVVDFDTVASSVWHKDGFMGLGANKTNLYKNTTSTYLYGSSRVSAKFTSTATNNYETKAFDFSANSIATDWSKGDTIVAQIYNKNSSEDSINLVFVTSDKSAGYYQYKLKLNWTGWKLVKIPRSSFAGKGSGDQNWSNINGIYINSNGWGTEDIADDIELYIDSIYLTSNASAGEVYVDFNDPVIVNKMGLAYAKATTSDTFYSAKITASGSAVTSSVLPLNDYCISQDWTGNRVISLNVYNKNSSNQIVNVVFSKVTDTSTTAGYMVASFPLNFTGWKTIEILAAKLSSGGAAPGLDGLNGIYFNLGGFGSASVASNVEFYVSNIAAKSSGNFVAEAIPDSVAVYAGSTKALNELSATALTNPPIYQNETLYVPLSLFETFFGASVEGYSLTLGGITMNFKDSSDIAKIGEYTHKLSKDAIYYNSEIYVVLSDICELFEIPLHQRGRLAVMGSDSDIDFIKDFNEFGVNEIDEQIADALDNSNSTNYTEADCVAVIENKLKSIVGNEIINDLSDSNVVSKIQAATTAATTARSLLNKTEGATELFTDQTSTESAHMTATANRIKSMALAYGTYGSELYQNQDLLNDILYSLEWFYQNRYGEDEINGNGWRSTTAYNWHDWKIGTPYAIIYTMMIVRDSLTDEQITNYLKCFHYVSPTTYSSGANFMDACELIMCAAALEKNPARINEYRLKAETAFKYVENSRHLESQLDSARQEYTPNKGHGFYTDGSYLYHTLHAMNGSYGISHITSATGIAKLLEGTKFELSKQCIDNMADWIINAFDTTVYGTRMMRMFMGRGENPSENSTTKSIAAIAVKCFDMFDEEDKQRVGSIIKKYALVNPASYAASVEFEYVDTFNEIISSDSYNDYRYDLANVFGNIDKVLHRRADWGLGISMSSSRIFNYESINGLNKNGWYLGDGRTELILKDEANSSASTYWSNINYYRLPGTTVDTQTRQAVSIAQGNEYLSTKDFVGGVELGGKYSTAAMHLESYHNDSDFGKDSGDYGGKAPAHTSDLTAKKSYFMFDNEIYCLGAEVNASNNNNAEVLTIVDNRTTELKGSSRLKVSANTYSKESKAISYPDFLIGSNWSTVSKIRVPVYSSANNGQIVTMVFNKAATDINSGYYYAQFTVNWTGWKLVELSRSAFISGRGIKNWDDINSMFINLGGWSGNCLSTTDLYFADIEALDSNGNVVHTVPLTNGSVATAGNFSFSTSVVYSGVTTRGNLNSNLGELTVPSGSGLSLNNVTWLNYQNKLGYLFPAGYNNGDLKANTTSVGYLETYISHGINPNSGTYAYALLPNMTAEETKAYAQNPDVEILSNTGNVQAVRYNKENITSIVFWNAGTFGGITVDEPMMVMLKDDGKELTLAVSDPTHKLDTANITIDRPLLLSYADSRITAISSGNSISLDIDFAESLGGSLEAKLKATEAIVTEVIFKNSNGNKIVQYVSHDETQVTANVSVVNLGSESYVGNVYAAMYSNTGVLESVQAIPVTIGANGTQFNTQITLNPTQVTNRIEIYVWDETGNKPCATLYRN